MIVVPRVKQRLPILPVPCSNFDEAWNQFLISKAVRSREAQGEFFSAPLRMVINLLGVSVFFF